MEQGTPFLTLELQVKTRVVGALGLLVGAKLINTSVPFIFSHIVDSLNTASQLSLANPEVGNFSPSREHYIPKAAQCPLVVNRIAKAAVSTMVTTSILGYGLARAGALGFNELRNAVFAKVHH